MRLASFHADGRDRIGFSIDGEQIVDLASAAMGLGDPPRTMLDLIEGGAAALDLVRRAEAAVRAQPKDFPTFAAASVTWHAPVRRPSKICCLALNNSANADRIMKGPKHPAMFLKPASSLVGHNGAIEVKPSYGRCHPEPELAVIIGKQAKNIAAAQSFDHVFGYSIMNDITSPTMREDDTFHYRAIHPKAGDANEIEYVDTWVSYSGRYKGADTFGCMGPWLVTRDEIPDPHKLNVACHHQGRLITEDNTENLFYKTPEVIAYLSHHLTLEPGDIVAMGTALKRSTKGGAVQNVDLGKLGGPVTVTIERLGTLSNAVRNVPD